jgi:shikimate 5-dehydrogenase
MSLRLLYKLYGSKATYAYTHEPVAKNQISMRLAELCRIDKINSQTQILGIIGTKQVINSLSLEVYDGWFKHQKQNKTMLPIVADSAEESISIINWIKDKAIIMGMSITMPYKKQLPRLLKTDNNVINSWLPQDNSTANTDIIAMQKALDRLDISLKDSVLILGTGATADTAMTVLEKMRIKDITLYSRHRIYQKQGETLRNHTHPAHTYDLLINCTPFGFAESDAAVSIPAFKSLVDLPYGKEDSVLVKKAKSENIPYIDGITFWKWQAEAQAEFFNLEPEFKNYINSLDLQSLLQ